ncbi:hypothetical protein [Maribacter sp. 2307UL18-2]|uniref:hypothetical protein n=1 Tax=Maribacter sp. 2307UL18-2 TaxID=3386274 RepID=UPI0039BC3AF8
MGYWCRFLICLICVLSGIQPLIAQKSTISIPDSLALAPFAKGTKVVNQCTPWHHLKCVYITGGEVYKDGRAGKSTRHWWRMSYIGQACTVKYGTVFGKIFEGIFAVPHYIGVGIGNGIGYLVYLVRGSEEKVRARRQRRKESREQRKLKREQKRIVAHLS